MEALLVMTGEDIRMRVEKELFLLKLNYPKKNTVSFRSQEMLEKIRMLEYILNIDNCHVTDLVAGRIG
jgi:hypothetical protein